MVKIARVGPNRYSSSVLQKKKLRFVKIVINRQGGFLVLSMTKTKFVHYELLRFHVALSIVFGKPFVAIPCESLCYAHQIETFRSDFQFSNLLREEKMAWKYYGQRRCSMTVQH